jgi:Ca2+-binding RTX toxin-like protein
MGTIRTVANNLSRRLGVYPSTTHSEEAMRRTTTHTATVRGRTASTGLTLVTALAAAALVPLAGAAPAGAAETCDGRVPTIVVPAPADPVAGTTPVTGTPGDDVIVGTEGDDAIDGAGGNDTICGLGGADTLQGGDGDDRLFGGADAAYEPDDGYYGDLLVPGAGNDHVDLGTGESDIWFWELDLEVDQVSYADSPAAVRVDLAAGTAVGHGTDTIVTGEPGRPIGVIGSTHDDVLLGTDGRDVVDGGAGDDEITTGEGSDVVAPDSPGRTDSGWRRDAPEPALVVQPGDDLVSTGPGSDSVRVDRGADVVRGDDDVDRLFSSSPDRGTRLLGGAGNDRFYSTTPTRLEGQAGNDRMDVALTDDTHRAWWSGGGGRDRLNVALARGVDLGTLVVDAPRRRVNGDGTRLATYLSVENVFVGDRVRKVTFRGGAADERFYANARRVRATGGGGDDHIDGSRGPDLLDGGAGRDRLDGGDGRDRCVRGERVTDCEGRR